MKRTRCRPGARELSCSPADATGLFGAALHEQATGEGLPQLAVSAALGCGVPTAVADLHEGEVVLDLGSGAGIDARPPARATAAPSAVVPPAPNTRREAGPENLEFLKGHLEELPLADETVDVVISNCVINLSADKPRVLAEAARVHKPGGRLAVSDVIADSAMDEVTKADMAAWTGCIAGALTEAEFRVALNAAGLEEIEIRETHRVHEHAAAAIIRAA